jgi:hypothetical protein
VIAENDSRCKICGAQKDTLFAHEKWRYETEGASAVATLEGVVPCCALCHRGQHFMLTFKLERAGGMREGAATDVMCHFCKVNRVGEPTFHRHLRVAMERWRELSAIASWRLDYGQYASLVESAEAKRRTRSASHWDFQESVPDPGPGHHMPTACPECGARGSLVAQELDTTDMSEGEEALYLSGIWGSSICLKCGREIDWGF